MANFTVKLINLIFHFHISVDSNKGPSLVDLAASSAGIDLKSEATNNQVQLQNFEQKEKNHVQSHHAYPSPFSQVYELPLK